MLSEIIAYQGLNKIYYSTVNYM